MVTVTFSEPNAATLSADDRRCIEEICAATEVEVRAHLATAFARDEVDDVVPWSVAGQRRAVGP